MIPSSSSGIAAVGLVFNGFWHQDSSARLDNQHCVRWGLLRPGRVQHIVTGAPLLCFRLSTEERRQTFLFYFSKHPGSDTMKTLRKFFFFLFPYFERKVTCRSGFPIIEIVKYIPEFLSLGGQPWDLRMLFGYLLQVLKSRFDGNSGLCELCKIP
uniref:Uncharacterized protein n=1 Tax=Nelumbo nucifera TaxID=4432 RepID=A0A822YS61_NELNU|nr:TPA_asm: hypothetical protein HUJ06_012736 [Nelumbo nucifera]